MKQVIRILTLFSGGGSPPAAPTGLTATPSSTSQIDLTWTDNATDESGYRVYRSQDNGSTYAQVGTNLAADSNSYSDTTVTAGITYLYKVAAFNAGGETLSDASLPANTTIVFALNLNETGGVRYDQTANHHDFGITGTVSSIAGVVGNAAKSANWLTSFLQLTDLTGIPVNQNWEVSVWINLGQDAGFYNIIGQESAAGVIDWVLWYNRDTDRYNLQTTNGAGTNKTVTSLVTCNANAWHHVRFGYDKTNTRIFISVDNETTVFTTSVSDIRTSAGAILNIGKTYSGTPTTNTAFDRFYMWSDVLSATARTWDYNGGSPLEMPPFF